MYRQYEDPHMLQERLDEARNRLTAADTDEEAIDIHEEIAELEERINFAWQDIEYDEDNRDYADEMWMYEEVW